MLSAAKASQRLTPSTNGVFGAQPAEEAASRREETPPILQPGPTLRELCSKSAPSCVSRRNPPHSNKCNARCHALARAGARVHCPSVRLRHERSPFKRAAALNGRRPEGDAGMAGAVLFPESSLVDRHSSSGYFEGPAGIFPLQPRPLAEVPALPPLQLCRLKPAKLRI